jgi:hypothetical protein
MERIPVQKFPDSGALEHYIAAVHSGTHRREELILMTTLEAELGFYKWGAITAPGVLLVMLPEELN